MIHKDYILTAIAHRTKYFMRCFFCRALVMLIVVLFTFSSAFAAEPDLDIRIGQMIMVGFRGLSVTKDHAVIQDILYRHIGGVILFDFDVPTRTYGRNIETEHQLRTLTSSLQERASIPLLIAIDQEGGKVSRLKEIYGFPPTVSQARLGAINNPNETKRQAEITAALFSKNGINLNLAPVVDLNINTHNPVIGKYERSFSGDPEIVTRHALAFIQAHHQHGILTVLKHFPGHGSAECDSQKGGVDVTGRWSPLELDPFRALISKKEVDLVMTAHIINQTLDPDWPATLSKKIITDLLRRDMGYDGIVISDDLQMKAILDNHSLEEAIPQAILAGVDIIILANNSVYEEGISARAVKIIKESISKGLLTSDRINESWERINTLKARLKKKGL